MAYDMMSADILLISLAFFVASKNHATRKGISAF